MKTQPIHILFAGHDLKFLTPLIEYCQSNVDYRVSIDEHDGHQIADTQRSARLAKDAQILFCEWALGNAVWYSKNKRADQILIVRLHLQEMDLQYLDEIEWHAVDHLVFICPENEIQFTRKRPELAGITELIYNPIPCDGLNQPKLPGAEFNLGFIGIVPMRKRADLATEILLRLKKVDRRFSLSFKGRLPSEYPWMLKRKKEMAYYDELYRTIDTSPFPNAIGFEPHGQDIAEWFQKIGFILSTSDFEGSHQAVAEGMATGAIPIIRNWAGADKLYPPEFVYQDADEAVNLILHSINSETYLQRSEACRTFARTHFDNVSICTKYEKLFDEALSRKGLSRPQSLALQPPPSPSLDKVPVLHICFLKPGIESGYRIRVMSEVELLTKTGHAVHLVVYTPKKRLDHKNDLIEFAQELANRSGATVSLFETDSFFDLTFDDAASEEIVVPLIELAHREGIKILHGQALYATRVALRASERARDLRVVFDCHGITPEETFMSGGHFSRMQALEKIEEEALVAADLTVMVSESMQEHFKVKYGSAPRQPLIVPCCVDADKFKISHSSRGALRKNLGLSEKFILGYLGTLASWQWPEAMFNLYAHMRTMRDDLHLMLMIPESDHDRAIELLEKAQIPENSRSLREVPSEEVGQLLPVIDAGLLLREAHPVNQVSSPTKFGEYLAAGVPVIATAGISDFSTWIVEHEVGLTLGHEELTQGITSNSEISHFIDSIQSERKVWGERCSRLCEEKLSWEDRILNLSATYSNLHID